MTDLNANSLGEIICNDLIETFQDIDYEQDHNTAYLYDVSDEETETIFGYSIIILRLNKDKNKYYKTNCISNCVAVLQIVAEKRCEKTGAIIGVNGEIVLRKDQQLFWKFSIHEQDSINNLYDILERMFKFKRR